jgi:hypothetical protein
MADAINWAICRHGGPGWIPGTCFSRGTQVFPASYSFVADAVYNLSQRCTNPGPQVAVATKCTNRGIRSHWRLNSVPQRHIF